MTSFESPVARRCRSLFLFMFVVHVLMSCINRPCAAREKSKTAQTKTARSDSAYRRYLASGSNMLRNKRVSLVRSSPALDGDDLQAVIDADPSTEIAAKPGANQPLELIFGFGGASVTIDQLVVALPETASGDRAATVEILVSSLSPHVGFQSIRADHLPAGKLVHSFSFRPAGARWVMLRFKLAKGATAIGLADVLLIGENGAPKSYYSFKESPVDAFKVLAGLKAISDFEPALSRDEQSLFADARDRKLDKWSMAEAALLASGVRDRSQRAQQLRQIKQWEQQARQILNTKKTPLEKAEALLQWLHREPMSGGYVARQTRLSDILKTKKFNCVSSAVLYNVLGRRLGLDLRGIEVPDHAFSVMYVGNRPFDVETTTPRGFNPARDRRALAELQRTTQFSYIPDKHRSRRREVDTIGLVALIYYNQGVELTDSKRYPEALMAYFRALTLDPEFPSAVKNVLSVLVRWSSEAADADDYERSLTILKVGLDLSPQEKSLAHNRKVIWGNWALSLIDKDRHSSAVAVLERAEREMPPHAAHFRAMQSLAFIQPGEKQIRSGRWQKALELAEQGLQRLNGEPKKELAKWRDEVWLRWAYQQLEDDKFEPALAIIKQFRSTNPDKARSQALAGSIIHQWIDDVFRQQGAQAAGKLLSRVKRDYGDLADMQELAAGFVRDTVYQYCKRREYANALKFIEQTSDLLNNEATKDDCRRRVYGLHAQYLLGREDWQGTVDVYQSALKIFPNDKRFRGNLSYCVSRWIKQTWDQDGKDRAHALLEKLKAELNVDAPDSLNNSMEALVMGLVEKEVQAGNYPEALSLLEKNAALLDAKRQRSRVTYVYTHWYQAARDAKKWHEALDVVESAIADYPRETRFQQSLSVIVQDGSWYIYETDGAEEARRFFAAVFKRYPTNKKLLDRYHYHVQRLLAKELGAKRFAAAEATVSSHSHLFPKPEDSDPHFARMYGQWADHCAATGDYSQALDVYRRALTRLPQNDKLAHNLSIGVQDWSWKLYQDQGAQAALGFLKKARQQFPKQPKVNDRIAYHVQRVTDQLGRAKKYADAVSAVKSHASLLTEKDDAEQLLRRVYRQWTRPLLPPKDSNWEEAASIYQQAVKQYPGFSTLKKDAASIYDRWARTYFKRDWPQAVRIYEKGLAEYPDDRLLKHNLAYAQQQANRK